MKTKVRDVRLAFSHVFEPQAFSDGEPAYNCQLLIDKNDEANMGVVRAAIHSAGEAKWGEKFKDAGFRKRIKMCTYSGETKDQYEGFDGSVIGISCRAKVANPPLLLDQKRRPVSQVDGKLYSGCYVVASLEFWAQDNQYGKRINCALLGLQHFRDGDSFSGGARASVDDFDEEEDTDYVEEPDETEETEYDPLG